jgi:hypothetical protein
MVHPKKNLGFDPSPYFSEGTSHTLRPSKQTPIKTPSGGTFFFVLNPDHKPHLRLFTLDMDSNYMDSIWISKIIHVGLHGLHFKLSVFTPCWVYMALPYIKNNVIDHAGSNGTAR